MDPRIWISVVSTAVSLNILLFKAIPSFNILLKYGKTTGVRKNPPNGKIDSLIETFSKIRVPKSWFSHYYVLYMAFTWPQWVFLLDSPITPYHVVLAMLTSRATIRTIESFTITKFGNNSTIHVTHYLIGIVYYLGLSMNTLFALESDKTTEFSPNPLSIFAIFLFLAASLDQHLNHRHLASLIKYSAPSFGLFRWISSAHYFDEIVIYTAVSIIGWSRDHVITCNYLSLLFFAMTNLSVSAVETRNFYRDKFDDYSVPWAVLPLV